jgi:mannose-6-phosphate isomerase-like protein (cupin superfamily)
MSMEDDSKKGYVGDIEKATLENEYFRQVLYTDARMQLVVMSLLPDEEIGEEVHEVDQFIRIEAGKGKTILNGQETAIEDGSVVIVPLGIRHNIINTSDAGKMKLYTVYAPANHKPGRIHKTKADAEADEEEDEFGKI